VVDTFLPIASREFGTVGDVIPIARYR